MLSSPFYLEEFALKFTLAIFLLAYFLQAVEKR